MPRRVILILRPVLAVSFPIDNAPNMEFSPRNSILFPINLSDAIDYGVISSCPYWLGLIPRALDIVTRALGIRVENFSLRLFPEAHVFEVCTQDI